MDGEESRDDPTLVVAGGVTPVGAGFLELVDVTDGDTPSLRILSMTPGSHESVNKEFRDDINHNASDRAYSPGGRSAGQNCSTVP